uniref:Uncharacterized protein n=1 Tax=Setaria italica TaxID=4555 RepID=K3Z131_SETIT
MFSNQSPKECCFRDSCLTMRVPSCDRPIHIIMSMRRFFFPNKSSAKV